MPRAAEASPASVPSEEFTGFDQLVERQPLLPLLAADDELSGPGLSRALVELLERRQELADWLDAYLEGFDVMMGSMVSSKTVATVTTITGALLFFFPLTSFAGAITLASGTSFGAGAWGSEAVAEKVAKDQLQALVDRDDAAHEAFGRELRAVLQGRRTPGGASFDAGDEAHVRAARAVEEWVRRWLLESAVPLEGQAAVEVSGLVPRMLSLQTKLATRRLRDAVISSLADLRRLEAMLGGGPAEQDVESATAAPEANKALIVGVLPALEASLEALIQKRRELLAKLEGLIYTCKLKRGVANSSKTVAAVATVTGAVLFFVPATSLAGLITIVSASGVGAVTTGGEATANRATMRALQTCADEDRAAEAAFDSCLRAALRGAGPGPLPSKVATLLGSWLGGEFAMPGSQPSLQSEAVRSLRMIWTPLDCAYSWATSSYTTQSVQQVYEDVKGTQEKLLSLQQCLAQVAEAAYAGTVDLMDPTPKAGEEEDQNDSQPSSRVEELKVAKPARPRRLEGENACVVAFLDGLIEERALILGGEGDQNDSEPSSLVEALEALLAKRKQLIDWMDQFLEGRHASQLAIGGSQFLSVVGNITGIVLLFIPATSYAGGIILSSMYGVDVGVGTNKTLMERSKESQLQRCVADDQQAQQAFDRRLLAVLRREEWPSGEAVQNPSDDASGTEAQRATAAVVEAWVQARSALAHGRGPRGGLGAGSGAALPLQAKETARQFREDLRRLLADLRELRSQL